MNRNLAQQSMHGPFLLWLAVLLVGVTTPAFGQQEKDTWLILTNGEKGSINVRTTREDLVRLYGAENAIDRAVGVGDGDTEIGTVLYPNDPKRTIEILWRDDDEKRNPNRVSISGKASLWHAVHAISLGTSYGELERLNGRAFPISWGTDQGSVVLSWKGGLLEHDLKGEGQVFIWFDDAQSDKTDRASKPGQGKQERRINQIVWEFPFQVKE